MSMILRFINENDFQNFTSQLFSAEFPTFQPIEGAGGDGGLDGIDGTTGFQMYFPEEQNRKKAKFVSKIDTDLGKLPATVKKLNLDIKTWVLVVPLDLGTEVVAHLQAKSRELGITCIYWGATKLTELVTKHPHVRDAFPGIFLPDIKQDLGDVKDGVAALSVRRDVSGIEILSDDELERQMGEIDTAFRNQAHGAAIKYGGSSAVEAAGRAFQDEANRKRGVLKARKAGSDRAYELERDEITERYEEADRKKRGELSERGMFHSGFGQQELATIAQRRERELERLKLKYGKR